MMRWGRGILLCFVLGLLFFMKQNVYAKEEASVYDKYYEEYKRISDFEEIDSDIKQIESKYNENVDCSIEEILNHLLRGNVDIAIRKAFEGVYYGLIKELDVNRYLLIQLVLLLILSALFRNYSTVIKISYVGEQGFYLSYLMVLAILIQSFRLAYEIGEETVCYIKDLMNCLLPAFCLSLLFCSGFLTYQMVNTMFLGMIDFTQNVLLTVILPFIRLYFYIVIFNQINKEDRFSKLAGLIKQGIQFVLKLILTSTIGLNVVKSMLVPVYENSKFHLLEKGLSMIPGGSNFTGLGSILIGAGILIKNSVGITIVLVLLVLTSIPILKIFLFFLSYKLIIVFVQPICDKRILVGIQGICDSLELLLRASATSTVLSILSVAIVIISTNVRM